MVGQYKQQVDNIMQREVSRGEFLKYIGIAFLGIVGFVGFLKNLHDVVPANNGGGDKSAGGSGYGGSPYGR